MVAYLLSYKKSLCNAKIEAGIKSSFCLHVDWFRCLVVEGCQLSAFSSANSLFERITSPPSLRSSPPFEGGGWGDVHLRSVICHSERSDESLFCHFWLDPKVTKKSRLRLRALRTPSRRFQVGKSGNSLGSDSLIFYRPARCSVGSPPEAHGRTPKAFACSPNAALPHSPFEGGLLGGCSSAFGYRVYHA